MGKFVFAVSVLSTALASSVGPPISFKDVKADITKMLVTNNDIWPFDSPTTTSYGPFMIRHAWHCAGSYRISDGKGGCDGARQRFDPERSWEDNTNLDKAKLLLYPIKAKYGNALSWGDLIILAGTTAIEDMGGPKLGEAGWFCGGRIDDADGTDSLELGPTLTQEQYAPCVTGQGACESPLGPTTLGLIYVNPAGPQGNPDPVGSSIQVRDTFARMAMNDSETVALIGGGHAFGKTHGACEAGAGPAPDVDPTNPWPGLCGTGSGTGKGNWTYTSGFEGPWTKTPNAWGKEYFENLVTYNYTVVNGSGNKPQWRQINPPAGNEKLMMLTSDISLTKDANYSAWVATYFNDIKLLEHDFGNAWYKLVTRDMGPVTRCLGDLVPPAQGFQYPLPDPPAMFPPWDDVRGAIRTAMITKSDSFPPDSRLDQANYYGAAFTTLAWQCASTFRKTDYLGGCNGARIRYSPQADWPENQGMDSVREILESVHKTYKNLSHADLIVLAAQVALEDTVNLTLPAFCPGRTDAEDGKGSEYLTAYNYTGAGMNLTAGQIFIHKNTLRGLNLREAVALQGRLRSQAVQITRGYRGTWGNSTILSNAYFKTLLEPDTKWTCNLKDECKSSKGEVYMLTEDLALKWEPSLFTIAEQYAENNTLFLMEFAWAWNKLVTLDRFKGPNDNVCRRTPPGPTPGPTPAAAAATSYGGIIGAGIGGLVLGALIVFVAMRSSNKKDGEMYHRAS
jgi:catalase (peroxidase I)